METGQIRSDLMAILQDPSNLTVANRIASSSAFYNAMMRTTCIATLMKAGHAENALPQSAQATINCRMLPEDNAENVLATLNEIVADTATSVICTYASFVAPRSPLREDVLKAAGQISASLWPEVKLIPAMSTGATDGKYLRRDGIPVYGISGMFGDTDDIRAHGRDERIGIKEFYEGVEFMYRFMKALTSEEE